MEQLVAVEVDGRAYEVRLQVAAAPWAELGRRRKERGVARGAGGSDAIVCPMQGTVLAVEVANGDVLEPGRVICVVEAMKMENEIVTPHGGVVSELAVSAGDSVTAGQVVCVVGQEVA